MITRDGTLLRPGGSMYGGRSGGAAEQFSLQRELEDLPAQIETREVTRKIGRTRACSRALRRGDLTTLLADEESFVFSRKTEDGDMAIVVLTRRPKVVASVPLPPGAPVALVDVVTGARVDTTSGSLDVANDAFGIHVYVAAESACAATR